MRYHPHHEPAIDEAIKYVGRQTLYVHHLRRLGWTVSSVVPRSGPYYRVRMNEDIVRVDRDVDPYPILHARWPQPVSTLERLQRMKVPAGGVFAKN